MVPNNRKESHKQFNNWQYSHILNSKFAVLSARHTAQWQTNYQLIIPYQNSYLSLAILRCQFPSESGLLLLHNNEIGFNCSEDIYSSVNLVYSLLMTAFHNLYLLTIRMCLTRIQIKRLDGWWNALSNVWIVLQTLSLNREIAHYPVRSVIRLGQRFSEFEM